MKQIKRLLKAAFPWLPYLIKRIRKIDIVENVCGTDYPRNALMVYLTNPFRMEKLDESHQNYWQMVEIAKKISEKKYNVDVIDYDNTYVHLKKNYDLVIDNIPRENQVYLKHLKKNAVKIAYLTESNPSTSNSAQRRRLHEAQVRRNTNFEERRMSPNYSREIETFDAAFMIGNAYNYKSYTDEFDMPPVYYIRNNGYCFPFESNYRKKDPRKFWFFASSGQINKGLDLLLEVFSKKDFPCELYICSTFEAEEDFVKAYYKELYETPNIHALGFVDIRGEQFRKLVDECAYSILPSCSEGLCGSVLTTMSAGVIPICSRECGFEDDEVIILENCMLDTIEKTVLKYCKKDPEWIEENAEYAKRIVSERYSQQSFLDSMHYAFDQVLPDQ